MTKEHTDPVIERVGANGQVVGHVNIGDKLIEVDAEIAPIVQALNDAGVPTIASCSGHGHRPGNIVLRDGRELIIARNYAEARAIDNLFPLDINGDVRRCETEIEGDDGWSDWIHPAPGYLLECCDCGLVHQMQFKLGARDDKSGALNEGESDETGVIIFRAHRLARAGVSQGGDEVVERVARAIGETRQHRAPDHALRMIMSWDDQIGAARSALKAIGGGSVG